VTTPFGDDALRFIVDASAPRRELAGALRAIRGVNDVVLTEEIGCVVLDTTADRSEVHAAIRQLSSRTAEEWNERSPEPPRTHVVHVIYDGEDLDAVASTIGRTREATIALHVERDYTVAMLGFLPGFAYLRDLDERLRLPRRAPRPRVPAGSVAIAASYTGIYPYASAGGWHLLGRTVDFEPFTEDRATFAIGDVVRFEPRASALAAPPSPGDAGATADPARPHLEVVRIAGVGLVVDRGRQGRMHEGIPPGGPLVRASHRQANALVGNDDGAAAIELFGTLEVVARHGPVTLADAEARTTLAEGARHVIASGKRRVTYLAVEGGVDAPVRLGGRGALLAAGIGRPVRRGDRIVPGPRGTRLEDEDERKRSGTFTGTFTGTWGEEEIAVMNGPDAVDAPSLEGLELRVSAASDRTGTRLEGWEPPREMMGAATRRSTPMVQGAIELTPSGLIVLGPDHPTTGGYPVVGVVRRSSFDAFFGRPPGARVRFVVG
jgi:KipI family sensor histidine kinase inhibitor